MVFNIATAHRGIIGCIAFKFCKNLLIGLLKDIGQNIKPTSVRHSHHDFLHFMVSSLSDYSVQCCNRAFPTFERKPFLTDKFSMQEFFKNYTLIEFFEDSFFLLQRQFTLHAFFKLLSNPVTDFLIVDIGIFYPDT